jgi:myb proto-oncogene protein
MTLLEYKCIEIPNNVGKGIAIVNCRWHNSLAPNTQQSKKWDEGNDVALIQACKKHGHRWSKLAEELNHTINENRLKNHFYSTVRKMVRRVNEILKKSRKDYQ